MTMKVCFLFQKRRAKISLRNLLAVFVIIFLFFFDNHRTVVLAHNHDLSETVFTTSLSEEIINSLQQTASVSQQLTFDNHGVETPSAVFKKNIIVNKLIKKDYRVDEEVSFTIQNASTTSDVEIQVVDHEGNAAEIESKVIAYDNVQLITIKPPKKLRPGKYKVVVHEQQGTTFEQDFTWGVLALNTNKAVYRPFEKVIFSIAVLDDDGEIVCDADVTLLITQREGRQQEELSTSNGKIHVNSVCGQKEFTLSPDYEAEYIVPNEGIFDVKVIAKTRNGIYSIQDTFVVKSEAEDFIIERKSATRLYPPLVYPMNITITANQDFKGKVVEVVPNTFGILPPNDESQAFTNLKIISPKSTQDFFTNEMLATSSGLLLPFRGFYALTQGFGEEVADPLLRKRYGDFGVKGHDGVDFELPYGTEVLAVDEGKVRIAEEEWDYGTTIVLEHTWGKSYYGHLSKLLVQEGDSVVKGQVIGLSGNTGLSTNPHLHFGIKLHNSDVNNGFFGKINPLPLLGIEQSSYLQESVQVIVWDVALRKGESKTLGYRYKAPLESPQFYLLGPVKVYQSPMEDSSVVSESPRGQSYVAFSSEQDNSTPSASSSAISALSNPDLSEEALQVSSESAKVTLRYTEQRSWQLAIDAQSQIDNQVHTTTAKKDGTGADTVFLNENIGYTFYGDSGGTCVYKKTTNGGVTWGSPVTIDSVNSSDCIQVVVWYDRWTPNDMGNYIHVVTKDNSADDLYYTRLDTSNDSASTTISIANGATYSSASSIPFISKSTNGKLYVAVSDATSLFVRCDTIASNCTSAGNWSNVPSSPLGTNQDDEIAIMPLENGSIMVIQFNDSNLLFRSNIFTDTTSTWSGWTTIDNCGGTCTDHGTYETQWGVVQDPKTYKIYLGYVNGNSTLGTDDDARSAVYSNGAWTLTSNVITDSCSSGTGCNDRGLTNAKVSLDENTGDIYYFYTAATTPSNTATMNIYWKKSTDGMRTWSNEQGPLNTSQDDIVGARANIVSSGRLYVTWLEKNGSSAESIEGNTIVDYTSMVPDGLSRLMRHGKQFRAGALAPFRF